ncbi:MAG: transmembrane anchor protein [Burkholderiaceae bacterium]
MYNAQKPTADELPSTARLIKSTILAAVAALAILITVVLPAEYGIDPTRIGNVLGLTEMGEIKSQLAKEAAQDHQMERKANDKSSFLNELLNLLLTSAIAQNSKSAWTETLSFNLSPGEGTEIKLVMNENAEAQFLWSVEGGKVNFDLHGDGSDKSISYKKGRGVDGDEGTLKAAFTGNHGWFWRSRNRQDITVTLHVRGDFQAIKRDK